MYKSLYEVKLLLFFSWVNTKIGMTRSYSRYIPTVFKKLLIPIPDDNIRGSWTHLLPWTRWIYRRISSERNSETSWGTPTHWVGKKNRIVKWVGKADTQSCHKPNPDRASHNWEGAHNSHLLSEAWRAWTPVSGAPTFKISWEKDIQNISLWKSTTCIHKTHKTISKFSDCS